MRDLNLGEFQYISILPKPKDFYVIFGRLYVATVFVTAFIDMGEHEFCETIIDRSRQVLGTRAPDDAIDKLNDLRDTLCALHGGGGVGGAFQRGAEADHGETAARL